MSAAATTNPGRLPPNSAGLDPILRASPRTYLLETRSELLKLARLPAYSIPTLAFPIVFYAFFGLSNSAQMAQGVTAATYLLATFGAFGTIAAALFGVGVGVAIERGQGWLLLKRASPMPIAAYFAAKVAASMAFALLIVVVLFAVGSTFGGVRLVGTEWFTLAVVLVFGALPFCALGLAVAYLAAPNSAPAIINIVYLPLSFAGGLWVPYQYLPASIQVVAPWLPTYHLAQLALTAIGLGQGSILAHIGALVGWSILGLGLATFGWRRDEGKTYG